MECFTVWLDFMLLHVLYKAAVCVPEAETGIDYGQPAVDHQATLVAPPTYVFLRKSFISVECSGIFLMSSQSLSVQ